MKKVFKSVVVVLLVFSLSFSFTVNCYAEPVSAIVAGTVTISVIMGAIVTATEHAINSSNSIYSRQSYSGNNEIISFEYTPSSNTMSISGCSDVEYSTFLQDCVNRYLNNGGSGYGLCSALDPTLDILYDFTIDDRYIMSQVATEELISRGYTVTQNQGVISASKLVGNSLSISTDENGNLYQNFARKSVNTFNTDGLSFVPISILSSGSVSGEGMSFHVSDSFGGFGFFLKFNDDVYYLENPISINDYYVRDVYAADGFVVFGLSDSSDGYFGYSLLQPSWFKSLTTGNLLSSDLNGDSLVGVSFGLIRCNTPDLSNHIEGITDKTNALNEPDTTEDNYYIPLSSDDTTIVNAIESGLIDDDSVVTLNEDGTIKDIDGMTLAKLQELIDMLEGTLKFEDIQGYLDYIVASLQTDSVTQKAANKILKKIQESEAATADDVSAIREILEEISSTDEYNESELKYDIDIETPLLDKFPFCLPFDLYKVFTIFVAEPVAPRFTVPLDIPAVGLSVEININLSEYDNIASLVRWGVYITFCLALILVTNKLIGRG